MVSSMLKITEKPVIRYPRSVAFIISNEFCERFNYYGMRAILVLYLTRRLGYDDDTATVFFHVFTSLVYFFPLFGAIIADSYLGRYKTILYLSIVYAIGTVIIAFGAIPPFQLPAKPVTVVGLLLIAVGTGGIKPCVSAFGGDQFKIPEQAKQLASFFSLFYFSINAGSLVSTTLTPIFREDVHCFNENDCFPLAFGVPALLMVLSIVIFMLGKRLYVIKDPSGNMILAVFKCIIEAIRQKTSSTAIEVKEHWLDYAEPKYGHQLVSDTKSLLKILVLYLPLPVFWALFDQQGSRWTFQATKMIGNIGGGFSIKPDQMQVVNPLLILIMIPIFDAVVYPILARFGIKRQLQKITAGGLLAAAAFFLSGFLQLKLEKEYPTIPGIGEGQLRIFNGLPCDFQITSDLPNHESFTLAKMGVFEELFLKLENDTSFKFSAISNDPSKCKNIKSFVRLKHKLAMSYFLNDDSADGTLLGYEETVDKPKKDLPVIRVLTNFPDTGAELQIKNEDNSITINTTDLIELPSGEYHFTYGNKNISEVKLEQGAIYVFIITGDSLNKFNIKTYTLVDPNQVHMLWQLPQYIVITAGEVMFSVTGLEFSFTQAPASMKSVLQACWLLTVTFGNLLVVVIAEFIKFESQALEFFCFAVLMVIDMAVFILLAMRYTYVNVTSESNTDNELASSSQDPYQNKRNGKIELHTDIPTKTSNGHGHSNDAFIEDR